MENRFMNMTFELISFDEIMTIWKNELWPERQSQIEPLSYLNSVGEIDMSINQYSPVFAKLSLDQTVIAVSSLHQTSLNEYRLRGNWVTEKFRHKGVGTKLIKEIFSQAKFVKNDVVWTMSRLSNTSFYKHNHFIEALQLEQFEYGPHCIMKRKMDDYV